jgi:cytidine deaminase
MNIQVPIEVVEREELRPGQRELLEQAIEALDHAHAPYSGFRVAAAARLADGQIVTGTNQENASYPVGICAERVALSTVNSIAPGARILEMVVTYRPISGPGHSPLAPCGMCRQALVEQHVRQKDALGLILAAETGPVWLLGNASDLLPLAFTPSDLD